MNEPSSIDVLLVDDSGFFRTVVSDKLAGWEGLSVRKASSGPEALEVLEREAIDCVVSDFEMPEMTGLELYERVEAAYGLPFVLLTGQGDEETASRAIGTGVDDYLRKAEIAESGQLDLLANRIRNVVAQRQAREKYELLVNNTPDEISQVGKDGTIMAANEATARSFDTTQSALVGKHLTDILPKETAASRLEEGRRALTINSAVTFQDSVGYRHFHNVAVPVSVGSEADSFQLITRDITQQKRREQQLEERTEKLAVINRLVRHDINNDIQLLIGWADGVSDHVDEEGQAYLDRIQNTCDHISELTTIARDFVESIGSDTDLEYSSVNLRYILQSEVEKAERRHENLVVSVDGEVPKATVRGNELLSSVFGNLLSNAVRHNNGSEPRVNIRVEEGETDVRVHVADNGPGIPEATIDGIFGKGEMGPESPGTGIGLYLVHTIVDRFGGQVSVENTSDGLAGEKAAVAADSTGCVFTVELPKYV
ncbi:ATP-binding protein [Halorhabdus sp. BNX81]|uniref:ATP-binding protein n=1 Tax=Halorhabdus sp. BNX81 TaxID=2980181 RepID=UPI0023DD142A|nr:ATP-binding protein [Halorhabdus sp. BNX81]WEL21609.1 Signal transduction regulator, contains Rec and HTH domains [Halorhabdus sp. BNX81]